MKNIALFLYMFISINAHAVTINTDDTVTLSATEWFNIKTTLQTLSSAMANATRDKIFSDNAIRIATSERDALKQANATIISANATLLNERDSLIAKIAAMANCPKAPLDSGPTNAMVSWDIPTQRVSGRPISPSEVGGFFLHYGTNKDNLNVRLKLPDRNIRQYTINGLATGTYYFAVSAYDTDGVEGFRSELVTKIIK